MASQLEQWRLFKLRVIITAMTKFLVDVTRVVGSPLPADNYMFKANNRKH